MRRLQPARQPQINDSRRAIVVLLRPSRFIASRRRSCRPSIASYRASCRIQRRPFVRLICEPAARSPQGIPRRAARNRKDNDLATPLLRSQHDLPHRPATGAVDAGDQLDLPGPTAAAVVAHTGEEIAERQGALCSGRVGLRQHARLVAAVALDLTGRPRTARRGPRQAWVAARRHSCASAGTAPGEALIRWLRPVRSRSVSAPGGMMAGSWSLIR